MQRILIGELLRDVRDFALTVQIGFPNIPCKKYHFAKPFTNVISNVQVNARVNIHLVNQNNEIVKYSIWLSKQINPCTCTCITNYEVVPLYHYMGNSAVASYGTLNTCIWRAYDVALSILWTVFD